MSILAIDQGTTGTTTIIYDKSGLPKAKAYREFTQIYPKPGWVEHDPEEIWQTVVDTVQTTTRQSSEKIEAIGITNQRETTVVWDKVSGKPIMNAIVWQCRRTASICKTLEGDADKIRSLTGLPVDAYFSGSKIKWILDTHPGLDTANLCFGTIDTWLIYKLTGGHVHATDYTNASRTMLFDITKKQWSDELCQLLKIPQSMLPEVRNSGGDFGSVSAIPEIKGIPITGVLGDQQAALFGQTCFEKGRVKNTYGTGCFMMMNLGQEAIQSRNGLLTTLAANEKGEPCYALEGAVFIAGAAIQWLRDELKILETAAESEAYATSLSGNDGVYLVPAFAGLGAPHWNMDARGIITGLTRGSNRNHFIRAALESMAYQTDEVLSAMEKDTSIKITELSVDGGACANNFLMQFQSDISQLSIIRPSVIESTSLGAAYCAGLNIGFWKDADAIRQNKKIERIFTPAIDSTTRYELKQGWQKAIQQTLRS